MHLAGSLEFLVVASALVVSSALAQTALLDGGGGLPENISTALPGHLSSPHMDGPITLTKS